MIKRIITILSLSVFFILDIYPQNNNKAFTIVIDPGHGGRDGGCRGKILKEKNLNLNIALKVGSLIEKNMPDVRIVYTRKTDVYIELDQRTNIANKCRADLFISIHADAIPRNKNTASAYGAGTFTLGTAKTQENLEVAKRENAVILLEDNYEQRYQGFDPESTESYIMFETLQGTHQAQSILFASFIQKQFKYNAERHDRQVRQAPYLVLKTASMPAVLVEVGFLSNEKEEKYLATENGKDKIAESIYYGFKNYKENFERHNEANSVTRDSEIILDTPNDRNSNKNLSSASNLRNEISNTANQSSNIKDGKIVYKVQFLSYYKKLNKGASQLKGLWPVEIVKDKDTYKYFYGETTDYNKILRSQREIRKKFKDAFVVKYKNGEKVR
ncbi:MAG: N-acetylmuramoyl-L-alanine amidase [Bacteroidales bacterium]|nr:N-acetylmuramoyl-L-alanine amidase [Bacteroidales bacterium]